VSHETPSLLAGGHCCAWCSTAHIITDDVVEEVAVDASQLLKGVLDVAVLTVVRDADGYGYDVVRRLRTAGLEEVGDASVYGTPRRLYQAGRSRPTSCPVTRGRTASTTRSTTGAFGAGGLGQDVEDVRRRGDGLLSGVSG
jgi:hypothetical protein